MRKNKLPLFGTSEEAESYLLEKGFGKVGGNGGNSFLDSFIKEPAFDDDTHYRIIADIFNTPCDTGFEYYICYFASLCIKDTQNDVSLTFSNWAVEDVEEWVKRLYSCGLVTPKSPKAKTPH